jgi:hypothetical protein
MGWSGLTLVTDAELGVFEPEAINGHWGATTWPNQRATAKLRLKTWIDQDFARTAGPNATDLVRDTFGADKVWGYTASTYTDVTDAAIDDTEDDVTLSDIFATFGTDTLYIGSLTSFDGLDVSMLGTLNANAATLTVKYSGPTGWTSLTNTDGTASSGKTFGKSGRITWTQPSDWQRRTLDNSVDAYYWIELSVSAALTSGTSVGQLLIIKPPDGLKFVCLHLAMGYIALTLAAQAPSVDYWHYKARNQFKTGYLDIAERDYADLREKGGIPIDVNQDNVIEEAETNVSSPLRMGRT